MSKFTKTFEIGVSIRDAKTSVTFRTLCVRITCRCSYRAELMAVERVKHIMLDKSSIVYQEQYGLTATQYAELLANHEINPLKHYVFKAVKCTEIV